jgi:hypothetical protein
MFSLHEAVLEAPGMSVAESSVFLSSGVSPDRTVLVAESGIVYVAED